MTDEQRINVMRDGPYMVHGNIPLNEISVKVGPMGKPIGWTKDKEYRTDDVYALCRCGKTTSTPFCDGSHMDIGFKDRKIAEPDLYDENVTITKGCEKVELMQRPILCTGAGFCHSGRNIEQSIKKEKYLDEAREQCDNCPGGSLTLVIDGVKYEPALKKEISVTNDVHTVGPIWVRGGIPVVSPEGKGYEVRNRIALCRCGRSKNMPFCDSSHLSSH